MVFALCLLVYGTIFPEIGIKFGPQRSDFDSGEYDLGRFKIGLFYSSQLQENLHFQAEGYFSQLGSKAHSYQYHILSETKLEFYEWEFEDILSYLEFPVFLKYSIPIGEHVKPFLFLGGYLAIRVSKTVNRNAMRLSLPGNFVYAERDIDGKWHTAGSRDKMDPEAPEFYANQPSSSDAFYIPPQYSPLDAGIVMGIGMEQRYGKTTVIIDFRVNTGIANVYYRNPQNKSRRIYSMSFMAGIGF